MLAVLHWSGDVLVVVHGHHYPAILLDNLHYCPDTILIVPGNTIYPHSANTLNLVKIMSLCVLFTRQREGVGQTKEKNMKKSTGEKLILIVLAAQAPSKPYLS